MNTASPGISRKGHFALCGAALGVLHCIMTLSGMFIHCSKSFWGQPWSLPNHANKHNNQDKLKKQNLVFVLVLLVHSSVPTLNKTGQNDLLMFHKGIPESSHFHLPCSNRKKVAAFLFHGKMNSPPSLVLSSVTVELNSVTETSVTHSSSQARFRIALKEMPCQDSLSNRNPFSIFDPGKLALTATIKKRLLPQADYSDRLLEAGIPEKKQKNSSWEQHK